MKHETLGKIDYQDFENNLFCSLKFSSVKKKLDFLKEFYYLNHFFVRPSDFFEADICQGNKVVSKVYGSYRGFLEFDGKRYWDYRYVVPLKVFL